MSAVFRAVQHYRQGQGRHRWKPPEAFGPAGIRLRSVDGDTTVVITEAPILPAVRVQKLDAHDWLHASISHPAVLPSYEELVELKEAVWGPVGFAYQVFASEEDHVNFHAYTLHLWGRSDGDAVLPRFGRLGMI